MVGKCNTEGKSFKEKMFKPTSPASSPGWLALRFPHQDSSHWSERERERERESVEAGEILINCLSLPPGTAGWAGKQRSGETKP